MLDTGYYPIIMRTAKIRSSDWRSYNQRHFSECRGCCKLDMGCLCEGVTETFHKISPMGKDEHMAVVKESINED